MYISGGEQEEIPSISCNLKIFAVICFFFKIKNLLYAYQ